jgi:hypothetical protein
MGPDLVYGTISLIFRFQANALDVKRIEAIRVAGWMIERMSPASPLFANAL